MVSWKGDGKLLTNLETREANNQDGRPRKIAIKQAEDMLGKSNNYILNSVELPERERARDAITTLQCQCIKSS